MREHLYTIPLPSLSLFLILSLSLSLSQNIAISFSIFLAHSQTHILSISLSSLSNGPLQLGREMPILKK